VRLTSRAAIEQVIVSHYPDHGTFTFTLYMSKPAFTGELCSIVGLAITIVYTSTAELFALPTLLVLIG
jgi:hypothetical protein